MICMHACCPQSLASLLIPTIEQVYGHYCLVVIVEWAVRRIIRVVRRHRTWKKPEGADGLDCELVGDPAEKREVVVWLCSPRRTH